MYYSINVLKDNIKNVNELINRLGETTEINYIKYRQLINHLTELKKYYQKEIDRIEGEQTNV